MNNDAFKELVRSKVKSTKEIARETVEEAFAKKHKKRKRRGGDGDDLDSSDSESESRGQTKKKKKALADFDDDEPSSVTRNKDEKKKKEASRYRDRAKERREGKNADYEDSQKLLETVSKNQQGDESALDATDVSKFLGGDEAHTHLVKGLDVALAQSVRQKMQPNTTDEQQDDDHDGNAQKPELESLKPIATKEEALRFFQKSEPDSARSSSSLGRSIFQYYSRRLKPSPSTLQVSSAGAGVQRTQFVFAVDWHPQNVARSWEVPSEKSLATTVAADHHSALTKASPVTADLIQQIKRQHTSLTRRNATNIMPPSNKTTALETTAMDTNMDDGSDDDIFPEIEN